MIDLPTKDEAIDVATKLASGELNPKEGAVWAQRYYAKENLAVMERLEENDPELEEFIGTLAMADAINEKGQWLYTTADFTDWLNEYLKLDG